MKIVGITSPKGGDGAGFVSSNIGYMLSKKEYKCLVIDLHSGMRTLDLFYGVSNEIVFDLNDVIEEKYNFDDAILKNLFGIQLDFITSSQVKKYSVEEYDKILNLIREKTEYDYIILDMPYEMIDNSWLSIMDKCLFVCSTGEVSVRCLEKVVCSLNYNKNMFVIINKVIPEIIENKFALTVDDLCDRAGIPPIGIIPYEPEVCIFEHQGIPSCTSSTLDSTKALDNITERITGNAVCAIDFNYKTIYYKKFKKYFRQEAEK